jgi:hypothetical protein
MIEKTNNNIIGGELKMVILEKPYISNLTLEYLRNNNVPVLNNDFARECAKSYPLNLITSSEMKEEYKTKDKIYTSSENALDWVYDNLSEYQIVDKINILKDKAKFRELLSPMYPSFYYKEVTEEELEKIDFETLKPPFVLKACVGFLSLGVYTIYNKKELEEAILDIKENKENYKDKFPSSVIDNSKFIIQQYIKGTG